MACRAIPKKASIFLVSFLVWTALIYALSLFLRVRECYVQAKTGRGWTGRVFRVDPELGFRTLPGARGGETFLLGPDVPTWIDDDGFRVPAGTTPENPPARPLVLALGCSFTFGCACVAEDTFSYRVARELGGSVKNAGGPSYGLAQMLLLARRLIPKWKPDYVLFQYSSWLIDRSRWHFAPTYFGALPTPFFEATREGMRLHPPLSSSILFDLPVEEYLHSPRGAVDFVGFSAQVGVPLLVYDDAHRTKSFLSGGTDPPAERDEIVTAVYREVAASCAANGARLVIVVLEKPDLKFAPSESLRELGCTIVDTNALLMERLPDRKLRTYALQYGHWRGDPPVAVDGHPNPRAHAVIAEAILDAIRHER